MDTTCSEAPVTLPGTFRAFARLKKPVIIGCSAVALATAVRLLVDPLARNHGPYLFFAVAVVIAALYGGLWAGIAATFLSIPVCDYLFIAPRYTWFIYDARGDSIMIALFAGLGLLTTVIIHRFHVTKRLLKQSFADLQQNDAMLKAITAAVPEILFTMTRDGDAEYLNERLVKYSGRELQELVAHGWLEATHPDDRPGIAAQLSTCFDLGSKDFEACIRLRGADGVYRWFKCHAAPVLDDNAKVKRWVGVCSNIDREKHLTDALERRTQELMTLNEGLERFAYAASHDLQAPLSTIGMITQLFVRREGGKLDEKSSDMLASISNAVGRMKRLIKDIMEFATANNAGSEASAPINARVVAELAISNLEQAIKESGAMIVLNDLPTIYAKESALLRLFQNLIANALKYRGKDAPHVCISASLRQEEWVFSIEDNGIGIDRQYHSKIFEPFRRLHAQSEYEGSGLGLSACQRVVQASNGRIWVESEVGKGATFFFTLPKHMQCENQAAMPVSPAQQSSAVAGR